MENSPHRKKTCVGAYILDFTFAFYIFISQLQLMKTRSVTFCLEQLSLCHQGLTFRIAYILYHIVKIINKLENIIMFQDLDREKVA